MSDLPFDVEPVVQPLHPHIDPATMPIVAKLNTSALDEVMGVSEKKGKPKKEVPPEEIPVNEFAALYIAESSDPGKGLFGVGLHGYVSTQVVAKRGYGLKKVIPTPKGYKKDVKDVLQVIREVVDMRIPLYGPEKTSTVANCIVAGCVVALEYVLQLEEKPKTLCLLVPRKNISVFLTKGYTKVIADGYVDAKGQPIPFKDVLDSYVRVAESLSKAGVNISVEYVGADACKGLQEALVNARDAVLSAIKTRQGEAEPTCIVSAPEGYWNHEHGRHPLLGKSRLVFRMVNGAPVEHDHLFLMDFEKTSKKKEHLHKLEIEVGQLLPSASYCVAKIADLDSIIPKIQKQHATYLDTPVERLGVMFLDAVFKPGAHSVMTKVGADYLHSQTYVTDLVDGYGAMFTHELNPARQAYRAWNTYLDMQSIVQAFLAARVEQDAVNMFHCGQGMFMSTDITSRFMEVKEDAKGKLAYKASKEVETPNTSIMVEGCYTDEEAGGEIRKAQINLSIGIDMPKRNAIAAMANEKLKAYVLVKQDTAFTVRHYVVVTNGEEYGIWAAPFANRTFVKK